MSDMHSHVKRVSAISYMSTLYNHVCFRDLSVGAMQLS